MSFTLPLLTLNVRLDTIIIMKIVYSDSNLVVCIKPSGVVSTDEPGGMPSLLQKELNAEENSILTVHRLDRVVSGLMVYARNKKTAASLSSQITAKTFRKEYLAVVHGVPEEPAGTMEDLLFRDTGKNKTYVVKRERKGVRSAALNYQVLDSREGLSLVRIELLTGRTHQIRAQFSSRSLPLVGDRKYGAADDGCEVALWSARLCFRHPESGETMDFSQDPPGSYPWLLFGCEGEPAPSVREIPSGAPVEERKPVCPYAKQCGGCQLQGIPYEEQLKRKQAYIRDLLGKYGEILPILGMEHPWHYRNKVHAAFGVDKKGHICSGMYKESSHTIVPIDFCLIEDETADRIIADVREMMPRFHMTAYNERMDSGFLRHVLVKRGFATGEVMVVLVATAPFFKALKPFLKELISRHPEVTTVILNVNDRFTPVVLGRQECVLYGPGFIEDELCGYRFRISAQSFYQINPAQTEKLYQTAISFAGLTGKETVLDAYCGTGTIGITASSKCRSVIGVETNKDAVQDAIRNAKKNGITNIWFACADAGEYITGMAKEKQHCDVVFMDPPRCGSDEKFLKALLKMKPERIIYISCGPGTQARDLKMLTAGGYRVSKIQPVDMFPHTDHVETVALLSRRKDEPRIQVIMQL